MSVYIDEKYMNYVIFYSRWNEYTNEYISPLLAF